MDAVNKLTEPFAQDEMILIALNDGEAKFRVQRALLRDASSYFLSALEGSFKEATERRLELHGCDAETFKIFLYWVCRKALPNFREELTTMIKSSTTEQQDQIDSHVILLIRVWVFGDMCLMPQLQNAAMGGILDILSRLSVTCKVIRQAFTLTAQDSVMRKLFAAAARYVYFSQNITSADIEDLAQIPGLITDFLNPLQGLWVSEVDWDGHVPVFLAFRSEYMVPLRD